MEFQSRGEWHSFLPDGGYRHARRLDRATRTWGGVFFAAQQLARPAPPRRSVWDALAAWFDGDRGDPPFPVLAVSGPCLVMAEKLNNGRWQVSVCDPDIRQQQTLTLRLTGQRRAVSAPEGVRVRSAGADTELTVDCVEGRGYTVELTE